MMSIEEHKNFLLAHQEPGRGGKIGSVDTSLIKKEKKIKLPFEEKNRIDIGLEVTK